MGGRRVDCRLFHTDPGFSGAFLALTTGIASQQNTAASRSLPDTSSYSPTSGKIRSRLTAWWTSTVARKPKRSTSSTRTAR